MCRVSESFPSACLNLAPKAVSESDCMNSVVTHLLLASSVCLHSERDIANTSAVYVVTARVLEAYLASQSVFSLFSSPTSCLR